MFALSGFGRGSEPEVGRIDEAATPQLEFGDARVEENSGRINIGAIGRRIVLGGCFIVLITQQAKQPSCRFFV